MSNDVDQDDIWPEFLNADILPPLEVMEETLVGLAEKTGGRLIERFREGTNTNGQSEYVFAIFARLIDYTVDILTISHKKDAYYPCFLYISELVYLDLQIGSEMFRRTHYFEGRRADNDNELRSLLRQAIQLPSVSVILVSLIARSNKETKSHRKSNADT